MQNILIKAIDKLREATLNGCRFMSFLYTPKGTGGTFLYTVNFGISYDDAVAHDRAALEAYVPQNELEIEAKEQMLKSMTERLTEGVSSSYTQKDTFDSIGNGIRQHKETGEIYIYCFVHSKEEVSPETNPKKPVNSKPLTLAKKAIENACGFKRIKFGQFIINPENIAGILVNGDHIKIQYV